MKMVENNSVELTEDEAELYDRQIRLWGLESQKRLRASRILLAGLSGLGAEVAKNIILAGVKSVTLIDHEIVTGSDASAQFLVSHEQIGINRAAASLKRAQKLNPMVHITADTGNIKNKPKEYFKSFDVVCITQKSVEELLRINLICREYDVKFFCGDIWGMFGYVFADLQKHDYLEDFVMHKVINKGKDNSKKAKTETVTESRKCSMTFTPLKNGLERDLTAADLPKKLKINGPAYLAMKVLQTFREENQRDPSPTQRIQDLEKLNKIREGLLTTNNINPQLFPQEFFSNIFSQISPACAIVGGVLAQEVIKTVSQREPPHNNFFFFDPHRCAGFIENVN